MKIPQTFTVRTILLNFGPWITYGLVSMAGHHKWAYVSGMIASLGAIALQWRRRHLKIIDGIGLLFFIIGVVSTGMLHSSLFPRNGSVLIWSMLAVAAWGSLLIGSPFTAEYARDAVRQSLWNTPGFRRVNAAITAVWGVVFVLNAALAALIASEIEGPWVQAVPYITTIFGVVFTNRFPQWASRQKPKVNQPKAD